MVHCTLLAITRLFYEYKDIFPDAVTEMLLHNVCLLLTSQSREVVGSSLSFLRVFVTAYPVVKTAPHLERIVRAVMKMTEDCKRHFRIKSRYLLERLVRKFGHDMLCGMVPKDDVVMQKRLNNIRKAHARKDKASAERESGGSGGGGGDSDDDEEYGEVFRVRSKAKSMTDIIAEMDDSDENDEMDLEDDEQKGRQQKRNNNKQQASSYIAEGSNKIVDFLDPSAAQKVTTVKPLTEAERAEKARAKKSAKNGGFKIAADGRLIIEDSEDDDDDDRGDNRMNLAASDDENDEKDENTFRALVSENARKRKLGGSVGSRRTAKTTATGSDHQPPAMKYQAGGTGIHRPMRNNAPSSEFGSEYRSCKARGDVKKKGKPDPYAYVPLQRSNLNRRKKAKNQGQFKNIVKGAQQGAQAGSKAKGKKLSAKMKKMKV